MPHPWDIRTEVDWSTWKPFPWLPWDSLEQPLIQLITPYMKADFLDACESLGITAIVSPDHNSMKFTIPGRDSELNVDRTTMIPFGAISYLSIMQDKAKLQRICEFIEKNFGANEKQDALNLILTFHHLLGTDPDNVSYDNMLKCLNTFESFTENYKVQSRYMLATRADIFKSLFSAMQVATVDSTPNAAIISASTGLGIMAQANAVSDLLKTRDKPVTIIDIGSSLPDCCLLKSLGGNFEDQAQAYNIFINSHSPETAAKFQNQLIVEQTLAPLLGTTKALESLRISLWDSQTTTVYCGTTNKPSPYIAGLGPALGCEMILWSVDIAARPAIVTCADTMSSGMNVRCLVKDPEFAEAHPDITSLIGCPIRLTYAPLTDAERLEFKKKIKDNPTDDRKIIGIMTGGNGQSTEIAALIKSIEASDKIFVVALGINASAITKEAIRQACPGATIKFADEIFANSGSKLDATQMNNFYNSLDLFITKPSESTIYEAMAVGVPTIFKYFEKFSNDLPSFELLKKWQDPGLQPIDEGRINEQVASMMAGKKQSPSIAPRDWKTEFLPKTDSTSMRPPT